MSPKSETESHQRVSQSRVIGAAIALEWNPSATARLTGHEQCSPSLVLNIIQLWENDYHGLHSLLVQKAGSPKIIIFKHFSVVEIFGNEVVWVGTET